LVRLLANSLLDRGWSPLVVLFRDLERFELGIEDIEAAIVRKLEGLENERGFLKNGDVFSQTTVRSGIEATRHVLILDGWDEFAAGATSKEIGTKLSQAINDWRVRFPRLRVVVTGRPGPTETLVRTIRRATVWLRLWDLNPGQFVEFVDRLSVPFNLSRVQTKAIRIAAGDYMKLFPLRFLSQTRGWTALELSQQKELKEGERILDVFASPLLTFLVHRLIATGRFDPTEPGGWSRPRVLGAIVDETCESGGRERVQAKQVIAGAGLSGAKLRGWLRTVASAMTFYGSEELDRKRLTRFMRWWENGWGREVDETQLEQEQGKIALSYYWQETSQLGSLEFKHKSIREYLHAENLWHSLIALLPSKSKEARPQTAWLSVLSACWLRQTERELLVGIAESTDEPVLSALFDRLRTLFAVHALRTEWLDGTRADVPSIENEIRELDPDRNQVGSVDSCLLDHLYLLAAIAGWQCRQYGISDRPDAFRPYSALPFSTIAARINSGGDRPGPAPFPHVSFHNGVDFTRDTDVSPPGELLATGAAALVQRLDGQRYFGYPTHDISGARFCKCTLEGCWAMYAQYIECEFDQVFLEHQTCAYVSLLDCAINGLHARNVHFFNSPFTRSDLSKSMFRDCIFDQSIDEGELYRQVSWANIEFIDCRFYKMRINAPGPGPVRFSRCIFWDCDVNLNSANFDECQFTQYS
jgi:hypothetical protein